MEDAFARLQNRPRQSLRRRKNLPYDNWDIVNLSFKLLLASNVCLIVGWLSYPLGLVLLIFGGLLAPLSISGALGSLAAMRKHKFLMRYGCAAIGEIKWRTVHDYPDFGSYHTVEYEFTTDEGTLIKGKWKEADKPFWESKRGDKVIFIYQEGRPNYHIAYNTALYEPLVNG